MGAVTSTVLFLLHSVTLGQVKAGTSSFIPSVLTYLSARCSGCVDDLDSRASSVGRDISEGLGRKQPDLHLSTVVSKLCFLSGPLRVKLNVLINFLHILGPPKSDPLGLISRPSVSLPNLFCFLGGSRKFLLCKISTLYSFIPLFLFLMLICFSSLDIPLHPPFQLGWKELQQQESPLSHPLQSDLLLWRLLAPGDSLAFGESTLARSSPESQRIKASCWDSAFHLCW